MIVISKKLKKNYGIEFGIGSFGFFVIKDVWIRKKDNVVIVSKLSMYNLFKKLMVYSFFALSETKAAAAIS